MRKLLALILTVVLSLNFAPPASAQAVSTLVPCSESPAFQQKSQGYLNTTNDPNSGQNRAATYSQALCGEDGHPHLVVDGRFSHAGDFIIPGLMFLYIAGWIGWVGRKYLNEIKKGKNPENKEVVLDVPLAFGLMLSGFAWPLQAFSEYGSGDLVVDEVPTSPR